MHLSLALSAESRSDRSPRFRAGSLSESGLTSCPSASMPIPKRASTTFLTHLPAMPTALTLTRSNNPRFDR